MRFLLALVLALTCSAATAGDYCRTYSVPVSNYYRVTRDPWNGQVYSREYIGTRYEQRTYCTPQHRYGFEPWIRPVDNRKHIMWSE